MEKRTHEQVLEDIKAGSKVCRKCGKRKPFSEFTKKRIRGDGYHSNCRECETTGNVRTKADIARDIELQSKVCSGCNKRKPFSEFPLQRRRTDGYYNKCRECTNKGTIRNRADVAKDIKLQTKVCRLCGERKPFSEFSTGITSDGCDTYCKKCRSAVSSRRQILKKYNITEEEYQEIISRGCEVCGSTEKLCIDHCHATGKVRGCLCSSCNFALGFMYDNPDNIIKLSVYIERADKVKEV